MKAIAAILCLAALFAASSVAPGCGFFHSRVIPFRPVPSVPDEPFWQAQPTDSVGLTTSKTTESEIPHANEWAVKFPKIYPCIVTRENGHHVLYGPHAANGSSSSGSEDSDFLDGICRWDLDSNDFEVRPFSNVQGLGSEVLAASIPGHPGPAFCRVYYDAASRNGYVPMGSRYFVVAFDTNGNQLSLTSPSTEVAAESLDLVNYQPIEYPDTYLFMLKGDEG